MVHQSLEQIQLILLDVAHELTHQKKTERQTIRYFDTQDKDILETQEYLWATSF